MRTLPDGVSRQILPMLKERFVGIVA